MHRPKEIQATQLVAELLGDSAEPDQIKATVQYLETLEAIKLVRGSDTPRISPILYVFKPHPVVAVFAPQFKALFPDDALDQRTLSKVINTFEERYLSNISKAVFNRPTLTTERIESFSSTQLEQLHEALNAFWPSNSPEFTALKHSFVACYTTGHDVVMSMVQKVLSGEDMEVKRLYGEVLNKPSMEASLYASYLPQMYVNDLLSADVTKNVDYTLAAPVSRHHEWAYHFVKATTLLHADALLTAFHTLTALGRMPETNKALGSSSRYNEANDLALYGIMNVLSMEMNNPEYAGVYRAFKENVQRLNVHTDVASSSPQM